MPSYYLAKKICEAVNITALMSEYGEIKNNAMRCIFHNDHDASLHIYENTNSFYCFGCQAGGDPISFIMKAQNIEFTEACRYLIDRYGIQGAEQEEKSKIKKYIPFSEYQQINRQAAEWSITAYKYLTGAIERAKEQTTKQEIQKYIDILLIGSHKDKSDFYIEELKNNFEIVQGYCMAFNLLEVPEVDMPENFEPLHIGRNDMTFYSRYKKYNNVVPAHQGNDEEITAENILNAATHNRIFEFENEIQIDEYISKARQKAKEYKLIIEFDNLIKSIRKQALQNIKDKSKQEIFNASLARQQQLREKYKIPGWILYDRWENPYINETAYINDFVSNCELKCINGKMYSIDGAVDDRKLEHDVQESISPFIIKNIAQNAKKLVIALKNKCYSPPIRFNRNEIHVNNGLLMTDGTFIEEKRFCINRLNVKYNPTAPQPTKWLEFLHDLLYDEDIKSLQEFLGYCLIPTTKSQVMMFIIGNGGEGKSVIGEVLQELYKQNMLTGKLGQIQSNRFFTANLESKLLFVDDDLDLEALPDTGKLKEVVTNPYHTIERKGVQGYETELCARLLCFGNGALNSLYDKTDGFYRRQIILKTKTRDKTLKKDNPMLRDEIVTEELQGIFNWMFEGLQRLIANNFHIYVSEMAKQNLKEAQEDNFNFITFLNDRSECEYRFDCEATTKEIFDEYEAWCHRNAYEPFKKNTISKHLANNAAKLKIKPKRYVKTGDGKYSRGYEGIKIIKNGY